MTHDDDWCDILGDVRVSEALFTLYSYSAGFRNPKHIRAAQTNEGRLYYRRKRWLALTACFTQFP
jgi:hypothetical protein